MMVLFLIFYFYPNPSYPYRIVTANASTVSPSSPSMPLICIPFRSRLETYCICRYLYYLCVSQTENPPSTVLSV